MWTSISLRPNAASSVARPEWRWRVSGRSTRIALAIRLSPYLRVHREALCRKRIRIDVTCRVVQRTISWNFTVSARHWARNLVCCRRVVARARARSSADTRSHANEAARAHGARSGIHQGRLQRKHLCAFASATGPGGMSRRERGLMSSRVRIPVALFRPDS